MTAPVFRFAPSPNGLLHLGHAHSALLNHDLACEADGRFLLRIEDIDTERCTPEFEDAIYRDLAWLGLGWEQPVRRQSDHFADYAEALDRLVDAGLAYPAFMSRGEIRAWIADREAEGVSWRRDPDGVPLYPAVERGWSARRRQAAIASGAPFAWRLDVAGALRHAGRGIGWRETGFGLLMLIVTLYAGGTFVTWVMEQLQQPVTAEDIVPTEAGLGLFLIALPGLVIIGPMIEEFIFRGWMLPALKQRGMGWIGALIVSSILFGLLHVFAGPASIAYTAVLGFTAGITRILSGRLWGAVLLHALNNLVAISVPYFLVTAPV